MAVALPVGVEVFTRGWLSSNNVWLRGAPGEGATLVDTGHVRHATQTLALVEHALRGEPLAHIVNTHLHSDHCGGNAALQRAYPQARLRIPPGEAAAVARWDEDALSYGPAGQTCERFHADGVLQPGEAMRVGARTWQALAAPGHDPHSLVFFDAQDGVLISADALWANGFGVVFPELDGEAAFDEVGATLDLIATLPVRVVIPGHGAPFDDVAQALRHARSRLDAFRRAPARHARHAAKALVTYHLLEVGTQPWQALHDWLASTPLMPRIHARSGDTGTCAAWFSAVVAELVSQRVLTEWHGQLAAA